MKCSEIGEHLMEVAAGAPAAPEAEQHLAACAGCAAQLESLRQTMSLLDQWQAPEPSPYFDTRLRARLREEAAAPHGFFGWLRKPALAVAMAALMTIGLLSFYHGHMIESSVAQQAQRGTAVGDLQDLDKNQELFANFDMLDDFEDMHGVQQTANP
jgi:anti-sigma factor RsiW